MSSSSSRTEVGEHPWEGGACRPTWTTPRGPAAPVWPLREDQGAEPTGPELQRSLSGSCGPADPEQARARVTTAAPPQSPSRPSRAPHITRTPGLPPAPTCLGSWDSGGGAAVSLAAPRVWRGHFLQGQPWLWELTHIVVWIWSFHLGLTVSLVWVWHRFQGTWLRRGRHLRKGPL